MVKHMGFGVMQRLGTINDPNIHPGAGPIITLLFETLPQIGILPRFCVIILLLTTIYC